MQVLLVDAYSTSKDGRDAFGSFKRACMKALSGGWKEKHDIQERRIDDLHDYVCDWEHDVLDEKFKHNCLKFDKIDVLCIGGDMKVVPWDPLFTHAITLVYMAVTCDTPLLGCGSGAFAGIYCAATQGARLNVLNGPLGDHISKLSSFPHYSVGNSAYPTGWYDNESGDIYYYDNREEPPFPLSQGATWRPLCNIGIHRLQKSGKPPSLDHIPVTRKVCRDDHSLDRVNSDQAPEAIESNEMVVNIKKKYVQSPMTKGLVSQSFLMHFVPEWHINKEGGIPTGCGLNVIGEDISGKPIIITQNSDKCLFITAQVDRKNGHGPMVTMMSNFFRHTEESMKNSRVKKKSLYEFLFGGRTFDKSAWRYDSNAAKKPMAKCIASNTVFSSLRNGPVRVDPPVVELFFPERKEVAEYRHASQSRHGTNLGKKPSQNFRNPVQSRKSRMELFIKKSGQSIDPTVAQKAMDLTKAENPYFDDDAPQSFREGFHGKMFDAGSNISERRNPLYADKLGNQIVKSPRLIDWDKEETIVERFRVAAGLAPPSTPPMTRTESGIRRPVNSRPATTIPNPRKSKHVNIKDLSFSREDWAYVQNGLSKEKSEAGKKKNFSKTSAGIYVQNRNMKETNEIVAEQTHLKTPLESTRREQMFLHVHHPLTSDRKTIKPPVLRESSTARPKSNYKKLQKKFEKEDKERREQKTYQGTYADIYRSPIEQEIHDYNEAKKKFVGPPFRGYSGKASEIPLRKTHEQSHSDYVTDMNPDILPSKRLALREYDESRRLARWIPPVASVREGHARGGMSM